MFAIENLDQFVKYVNEGANPEQGDMPVPEEIIVRRLTMLHEVVDVAVATSPIELQGELYARADVPKHVKPSPVSMDDRYPGPYL